MKYLLAAVYAVLLIATPNASGAEDIIRFAPNMKDDEAALYDLATALYRDKKVSDPIYKAALAKFDERGIMDIIGIIGYYDLVSMTLITMQAEAPNDSVPPLPALSK
jgi:4-carboxymuconolactone decarboxylase